MSEDFWVASGFQLADRADGGGLVATDDFLKAFLARPELLPPEDACPVERGLHAQLLAEPRLKVSSDEAGAIADADARENFGVFLAFRDRLVAAQTLEQAYLDIFQGDVRGIPPLFLQQLAHIIARNAFAEVEDAYVLRGAECFFRAQRVSFSDGQVLLADQEVIADHEHDRHHSPLLSMLGGPAVSSIEVLNDTNAAGYKARSDAHDMVLNVSAERGRAALGEAARIWIRHLTGVDLVFTPVEALSDENVGWFLPFDAEATKIGNAVWNGTPLSADQSARILALFRFVLPTAGILPEHQGKKGFAILAATTDHNLAIKPQNMIAGLPLSPKG